MLDTSLIKKESTKRLVSALQSLEILELLGILELSSYTEIQFRVDKKTGLLWQSLIERLLYANSNLIVAKKFVLKEGKLVFIWIVSVASEQIDTDVISVSDYIVNQISKSNQEPISIKPTKRVFNRTVVAPVKVQEVGDNKIIEWEIELPHTSVNRNKPKPGSVKGAFSHDEKGSASAALIKNFYAGKTRGIG